MADRPHRGVIQWRGKGSRETAPLEPAQPTAAPAASIESEATAQGGAEPTTDAPPSAPTAPQTPSTPADAIARAPAQAEPPTPRIPPADPTLRRRRSTRDRAPRARTRAQTRTRADALEPADSGAAPDTRAPLGFRERGRLQRRLRYLRQLREVQIRDLGGFVLELHRFNVWRGDLVGAKVAEAAETDRELRALESVLSDERRLQEVREAGIGGSCRQCGAIHGSVDRFCASCGASLTPGASRRTEGARSDAPAPPAILEPERRGRRRR
jgi:hypothetical protein